MDGAEAAGAGDAPTSATLMALKFELAMSIGESLELAPMARRFLVPLLQAVQGLHCLLWLRADRGPALRLAYPQRSLLLWDTDVERAAWLARTVALPLPQPQHQAADTQHRHALPVGEEGWLVIERSGTPIPVTVLDAIGVVLRRLARACRACHEHARARSLLAEKEAAERAMVEANARMAEIFSLSSDGFAYFDTQGRMAFCNPAVEALLGLPVPQLMGRTLAELDRHLTPLCTSGEAPALARMAATLDGAASCSGTLSLAQPQRRILAYTINRTDDDQRAVLYLRDVTRETEVDRMKSEFLTTAAHELRTPMVSVFGFTELLLHRPVPENQRREVLQTIHRQASLLIKLVNELLDLARIEARQGTDLQRQVVPLGPLVQDAVARLPQGAPARNIDLALDHDDVGLWVDPLKTGQALLNVLSNADKYSPGAKPIRISTHDGTHDGTPQGAPAIGLRITDQGIGMSPEQLARVFERFYRADPSGNIPGTGLGMSLVKEIVELQGGRVEVLSQLGSGTTVTLWLPLAAATAEA
ncbi:MAG: PAS domain-containing protein [Rubrivivax sp.]|nr:PAS domain-containing protein [Rubrivivax sp.]